MRVLGIETSCDETAAAVVDGRSESAFPQVVSNIIHSQVTTHAKFGGIVPEVASREHVDRIVDVVQRALESSGNIDGIAVTSGPGLIGSLLVGVQFAKGLALARGLPWIGINHLEGHLGASLLADEPPSWPHIALVVSGGHSHLYEVHAFGDYRVLGGTRDDAAGEAFDKVAKILGLGYPGGVMIEKTARGGNREAVALPRGIPNKKVFDFSFSGLKTASAAYVREHQGHLEGHALRDFCASLQEAIADALSKKAVLAAERLRRQCGRQVGVVLAGGVAANTRLRELLAERCESAGLWSFAPPKVLCTDNAAMIAAAGWMRLSAGQRSDWDHPTRSKWPLGGAAVRKGAGKRIP